MKLTSSMRLNITASVLPNGADSAMPAWQRGYRSADAVLLPQARNSSRPDPQHRNNSGMGNAGGDEIIQRLAIAAKHGDGGAGLHQRRRDFAADATPSSVTSACEERGSPDMRKPPV